MSTLLKIFDSRLSGIICFLFAIANRIIYTTLYSLIGTDTKIQITYSQNLMAGKGIGITKYFTNNLSHAVFDNQQMFPPGFSITIIPFLEFSGGNEFTAVLIFDLMVAVLFVITVRYLANMISLPGRLVNIITIVAGCSQYIFFSSWSSTDAIGLCLILLALTETIGIIEKRGEIGLLRIFGISVLFCLPFFFRYMYFPLAIIFPSIILILGAIFSYKKLKTTGLKLLLISVSLVVILLISNLLISGNAMFVQTIGKGIYFNQLIHWYPFLPASFLNLDFGAQLFQKITGISYTSAMWFFEIANMIIFFTLLILLGRFIKFSRKTPSLSKYLTFIISGSIISLSIILLLAYLSLTYKELPWGLTPVWTYVRDERYFAILYVFIPLLFFVCIHRYAHLLKKPVLRLFTLIVFCAMMTEVLHGVYYNIKIVRSHSDLSEIRNADKGYRGFTAIINQIKKLNPGQDILVCSPDQYYTCAASLMGCKAIFDYENLWQADLKVFNKSILVMPVHSQEAIMMNKYIEMKKPHLYSIIEGTSFYVQEIDP